MKLYPCVACGFLVFDQQIGSYAICPICDWEDDHVQARYAGSPVGANHSSLFEYQHSVALRRAPLGADLRKGFRRAPGWRPLSLGEVLATPADPQTGRAYFEATTEEDPPYYWAESDPPAS
jgi:hypothetical protein